MFRFHPFSRAERIRKELDAAAGGRFKTVYLALKEASRENGCSSGLDMLDIKDRIRRIAKTGPSSTFSGKRFSGP